MKVSLDKSTIEISLHSGDGVSMTESITPTEALRYAKTLENLAEQLIDEFPNRELPDPEYG